MVEFIIMPHHIQAVIGPVGAGLKPALTMTRPYPVIGPAQMETVDGK